MLTVLREDKNLNIRYEVKGKPAQAISIPLHACESLSSQIDDALELTEPNTGEKEDVAPRTAKAPSSPAAPANRDAPANAGGTETVDTEEESEEEEESDAGDSDDNDSDEDEHA